MNMFGKILFALAVVMVAAAEAAVTLPRVFGDNMVLQQGQKVPIWGWAAAGERVTVLFGGQSTRCSTRTSSTRILCRTPCAALPTRVKRTVNR